MSVMEELDTVIAILVQNMMGIVSIMNNVKKVSDVEQTIVQFQMDLMHI